MPKGVYKRTLEMRKIMSLSHKGKMRGKDNSFYGKKHTAESRLKMSISRKGRKVWNKGKIGVQVGKRGKDNHFWKGGVTEINKIIRRSVEYKLWRKAVFERDNYTCVWCKKTGCELHPDHIKPFAHYPELRFAIDNGRTLCKVCHKRTDTYGYKAHKFGLNNTSCKV